MFPRCSTVLLFGSHHLSTPQGDDYLQYVADVCVVHREGPGIRFQSPGGEGGGVCYLDLYLGLALGWIFMAVLVGVGLDRL